MLSFEPITLPDRDWIDPLLKLSDFNTSEYTFANNYLWRNYYHFTRARFQDFYILRILPKGECLSFLYPAGSGDVSAMVKELHAHTKVVGCPLVFRGVTKEGVARLEAAFPGKFSFTPNRDAFDYLYESEDLITLAGKKYHSKRNYINRFITQNWAFEPLDSANLNECRVMNDEWCKQNHCGEDDSKAAEFEVVRMSLHEFEDLHLEGALLRLDGTVVAFTIGEPLNSDTYIVHIEKAFSDVDGAYPTINREFAEHAAKNFRYINREEDTGAEGLRKAKLSYKPVELLEKYTAVLREEL